MIKNIFIVFIIVLNTVIAAPYLSLDGNLYLNGSKEISISKLEENGFKISKDSIEAGEGEMILNSKNYVLNAKRNDITEIRIEISEGNIYRITITGHIEIKEFESFIPVGNTFENIIGRIKEWYLESSEDAKIFILLKSNTKLSFAIDYSSEMLNLRNKKEILKNKELLKAKCTEVLLFGQEGKRLK